MPRTMHWLVAVIRLAAVPVFLGALSLWLEPQRSERDQAVGLGLALLGAIHVLYWWRPWPTGWRRPPAAAAGMVATNAVLTEWLGLSQPLLWLYPVLVVGAGLRPAVAAVGVALLTAVAVAPLHLEGALVARALGPGHWTMLAIALA